MALGRRGVFFTITAVLVVGLALAAFLAMQSSRTSFRSVEVRVFTLDNFLDDASKDLERAIFIAMFRATLGIEERIVETGEFLQDTDAAFNAVMTNGSYLGEEYALVENATLTRWHERVQQRAASIGIDFSVVFGEVRIEHTTPWDIRSTVNVTLVLADANGIANFTANRTVSSTMKIVGFEDPVYLLGSSGKVVNVINISSTTDFVQGNDTSDLLAHVMSGDYIAHNDSPSFLMRLEGNLSASPYGIESLVDVAELDQNDVPIKVRTAVDYLYFGNGSVTDYCIEGMPSWFRIDDDHLELYEVESLTC